MILDGCSCRRRQPFGQQGGQLLYAALALFRSALYAPDDD
jgi:hypothetical protein